MKEMLLKKKELLEQTLKANQEQMMMTQGAMQYNQLLLDELEASEKAQADMKAKEEEKKD